MKIGYGSTHTPPRCLFTDPKADSMGLSKCPSCDHTGDHMCVESGVCDHEVYTVYCSRCLEYLYHFVYGNYVVITFNEDLRTYFITINGEKKYKALILANNVKTIDNRERTMLTDMDNRFIGVLFTDELKYLT